jgi:hypothetical protein
MVRKGAQYQLFASRRDLSCEAVQSGARIPRERPHTRRPLFAVALGIAGIALALAPSAALAKPFTGTSYYVKSTDMRTAYGEGCKAAEEGGKAAEEGKEDGSTMVILDFGGQLANRTGTESSGGVEFANAEIEAYTEEFAAAYYLCHFAYTKLHLVIGTNNSLYSVSKNGGKAWADLVKNVANHVLEESLVAKQVSIYGGDDLEDEVEWSTGGNAHKWAAAYSETTESPYVDYGDAGGCPETREATETSGACRASRYNEHTKKVELGPTGWSQDVEYELGWEIERAHATPEIYVDGNQQEWALIGWAGGKHFGGGIQFEGPLNEYHVSGTYTNTEAWEKFEEELHTYDLNESMSFSLRIKPFEDAEE